MWVTYYLAYSHRTNTPLSLQNQMKIKNNQLLNDDSDKIFTTVSTDSVNCYELIFMPYRETSNVHLDFGRNNLCSIIYGFIIVNVVVMIIKNNINNYL